MRMIDNAAVNTAMSWQAVVAAMEAGHRRPPPELGDTFLARAPNGILVRTAWIAGLGIAVKAAAIFPANSDRSPPIPSIQGHVIVFDDETGSVQALIDAIAVTQWKTAGDSALGSKLLSRPDSESLLMVGAGTMSEPLIRAHVAMRPSLKRVVIWNRSRPRAEAVATRLGDLDRLVTVAADLATAVRAADIISVATMATEPVILGRWLKPGAHVDLVGAYKADMHEIDAEGLQRARVFVDFRGTTIDHIGDLLTPLKAGLITRDHILGDLYDLVPGAPGRLSPDDITVFENGGGAHLDLMTATAILKAVTAT